MLIVWTPEDSQLVRRRCGAPTSLATGVTTSLPSTVFLLRQTSYLGAPLRDPCLATDSCRPCRGVQLRLVCPVLRPLAGEVGLEEGLDSVARSVSRLADLRSGVMCV